jgi:anti-sigma-K factor RskA
MNYDNPQLLDELAAQFVLGTLRGQARARFERLRATHGAAQAAVQRWEDRLLPWSLGLAPVMPSDLVWPRIRARIAAPPRAHAARPLLAQWRVALAATFAIVAIGIAWMVYHSEGAPQSVALLAPATGAPLWRVEAYDDGRHLRVEALHNAPPPAGRALELWALPPNGAAPVSLGLMPAVGRVVRALTEPQRVALLAATKVAVSIELPGGSPTGLPTGAVIYVADLTKAS